MKTITFHDYLNLEEDGEPVLVVLATCPHPFRMDFETRNANVEAGVPLCDNCDGTGNMFMFKYKQCETCGGSGRGQPVRQPEPAERVT